jgi:hypothetical protein
VYRIPDEIRSTSNRDGGTVLNITRNQIFHVNAVGALILEALRQGCDEAQIAAEVTRRYDVSEDTALADVHEFLESLKQNNLIRTCNGKEHS